MNTVLIASPAILGLADRAAAQAEVDLAIIGAGAAGIMAARQAQSRGLTFQIFEARPRIGGRVFTDTSLGVPFDAGAAYLHAIHLNPWREVAEDANIALQPFSFHNRDVQYFRDGKPFPGEDREYYRHRRAEFHAAMEAVETRGDLSFAEVAAAKPEWQEAAQQISILSLGEDAERISVQDYQSLDDGEDRITPLGYGNLIAEYAQGLEIALSTPVTALDYSGAGVRVETPRGTIKARAAIITLPISLLQAEKVRFSPPLPRETLSALDGLSMGVLSKVALKFEGMRFGLPPFTQFVDQGQGARELINFEFWPFDRDVVLAMIGGDYARQITRLGEAEAVRHVLARLETLLGERVIQTFRAGRLAGWAADPHALGSYSIARPGHARARGVLAVPVAGRLFFAGEANAGGASMTAGGAALSARRAVDLVAGSL